MTDVSPRTQAYIDFLNWIPGISNPEKRLNFKQKLMWTGLMLLAFFVMSEITVWGAAQGGASQLGFLETVLGSTIGSLMTLGIGPIVTASIILQLLNGSGLIDIDTSTQSGKAVFQGTQKLLAVAFSLLEAVAFVLFGAIPPASGGLFVTSAVIAQIAFGGIIVILMDEVVSKWGIGSGISLFIAAGVSRTIFIRAFNFIGQSGGLSASGIIPSAIVQIASGDPRAALITLIPIFFTVVVFFMVVYATGMKVEIPLSVGSLRGFSSKYPLKLFYTSNIPVILVSAMVANLQLWANLLQSRGTPILGTVNSQGVATSGLIAWLSPPTQADLSQVLVALTSAGVSIPGDAIYWVTYSLFMIAGSTIFSIFWVETSGLDPDSVAERLHNMGMGVPGFRSDKRVIKKVLDRYIPALGVIGGALVGALAAFADFTGALGTGTGILLTVMILYRFYEELAQEHMEDMHPAVRKFMES